MSLIFACKKSSKDDVTISTESGSCLLSHAVRIMRIRDSVTSFKEIWQFRDKNKSGWICFQTKIREVAKYRLSIGNATVRSSGASLLTISWSPGGTCSTSQSSLSHGSSSSTLALTLPLSPLYLTRNEVIAFSFSRHFTFSRIKFRIVEASLSWPSSTSIIRLRPYPAVILFTIKQSPARTHIHIHTYTNYIDILN